MNEAFKLPGSGYEVLSKILHAYVLCGAGKTPLGDVSKKAGLDHTIVSRNNGFLLCVGALSGGRDKELTPTGRKLALAVGNNMPDDIAGAWKELLLSCETTRSVIEMVKVQKGVPKDQFLGRVASTLGVVADASTKTGLNTLLSLFEESKTLKIVDEKYFVHENALTVEDTPAVLKKDETKKDEKPAEQEEKASKANQHQIPSVHINVQVHISPESTPEQIEKIFECMAKHLGARV